MGVLSLDWATASRTWPHAGLSRFIDSPPHHWHVQIAGQGPDMLLLHGAGGSAHSWRDLLLPLARNYRVIAIDLPGHGFSRLGTRKRSGLVPMSEDIATLLARLGAAPAVIVGHSAGAAVALQLARILDPAPKAIVSINGALENFPGLTGVVFPLAAKALAYNPLTGPVVAATMTRRAAKRLIDGTGSHLTAEGVSLYHRLFCDRHHVAGTLAMMEQWSLDPLLAAMPSITVPALFLVGSGDRTVSPVASLGAARRVADGTVREFIGGGHLMHEEYPRTVVEAILRFAAEDRAPG